VGTLRSTDAAFTSIDKREASTHLGVGSGCGQAGHPTTATCTSTCGTRRPSSTAARWASSTTTSGGRTAGSGKGVVPDAVIAVSIALDALLLLGDLAELKAAGIRVRAGTARG
jgi:hypothetical protein